jgi:hypothetical protein
VQAAPGGSGIGRRKRTGEHAGGGVYCMNELQLPWAVQRGVPQERYRGFVRFWVRDVAGGLVFETPDEQAATAVVEVMNSFWVANPKDPDAARRSFFATVRQASELLRGLHGSGE